MLCFTKKQKKENAKVKEPSIERKRVGMTEDAPQVLKPARSPTLEKSMSMSFPRDISQSVKLVTPISEDPDMLDIIFGELRQKIAHQITPHDNPRVVARKIIAVLQEGYSLSTAVKINDFVAKTNEESSKALSQLAIATQRSASLFALEVNLLSATTQELENHIRSTKSYLDRQGFASIQFYRDNFVKPLETQLENLRKRLQEAEAKNRFAQVRFQHLRDEATRPIMKELQSENKKYTSLYESIADEDLKMFCDAVAELEKSIIATQSDVQQPPLKVNPQLETTSIPYLQELYKQAQDGKGALEAVLVQIHDQSIAQNIEVRVELGDLKSIERAMEKTVEEYQGNFSRLLDLTRASIECEDVNDATEIIRIVSKMHSESLSSSSSSASRTASTTSSELGPKIHVIRLKNRLDPLFHAAAESGGYRDMLMNLQLSSGHICELQIHIKEFLALKKNGGHKSYEIARSLHLLDSELGHVRVSAHDIEERSDVLVRAPIQYALSRVFNGTCQSLHLNYVKLSLAECEQLRLSLQSPANNTREIFMPFCGLNEAKSNALCEAVTNELGEFMVVDFMGNEGITGECVAAFISDDLEKLSVEDCRIQPDGCVKLVRKFAEMKPRRISELNLNHNTLGMEAVTQLAVALKKMSTLRTISIYGNKIGPEGAQLLAPALLNHTKLTSLDIRENNLGPNGIRSFVPTFEKLTNIAVLILSLNRIGSDGIHALAPALQKMTKIHSLYLSSNELGVSGAMGLAPALEKLPEISTLYLSTNEFGAEGIRYLRLALEQMVGMTTLNINCNGLGEAGAAHLAPALANMPLLKSLDLKYNELEAQGTFEIARALKQMKHMQMLNLEYNGIGSAGARHLAPALDVMTSMTALHLENNLISSEGIKHLAPALEKMTGMTELDLQDNKLGASGAKYLAPALNQMPHLTALDLGENQLDAEGAKYLAPVFENLTEITTLNLSSNEFEGSGAKLLSPAFEKMTQITSLDISHNKFDTTGAKYLGPALATMDALTSIDISGNNLDSEGVKYLLPALEHASANITTLLMGKNDLKIQGMKSIAPALRKMIKIKSLNISGNKIGEEGAIALEPCLQLMSNITILDLSSNNLEEDGAKHIASALTKIPNLSISFLDLSNNQFGPVGVAHLAPALQKMANIKSFHFSRNKVSPDGAHHLQVALEKMKLIQHLDLEHNNLKTSGMKQIAPTLSTLRHVTKLNLSDNDVDKSVRAEIKIALTHISNLMQ